MIRHNGNKLETLHVRETLEYQPKKLYDSKYKHEKKPRLANFSYNKSLAFLVFFFFGHYGSER